MDRRGDIYVYVTVSITASFVQVEQQEENNLGFHQLPVRQTVFVSYSYIYLFSSKLEKKQKTHTTESVLSSTRQSVLTSWKPFLSFSKNNNTHRDRERGVRKRQK